MGISLKVTNMSPPPNSPKRSTFNSNKRYIFPQAHTACRRVTWLRDAGVEGGVRGAGVAEEVEVSVDDLQPRSYVVVLHNGEAVRR